MIDAQPGDGTQARRQRIFSFGEGCDAELLHLILPDNAALHAGNRAIKANGADIVVPHIAAQLERQPLRNCPAIRQRAAIKLAAIDLLELVTIDRIIQEIGEVGGELEF